MQSTPVHIQVKILECENEDRGKDGGGGESTIIASIMRCTIGEPNFSVD